MPSSRSEQRVSLAILCCVVLAQAIALAPELSPTVVRQSDAASHFTLIEGMADALQNGGNPLDFWSPESCFGFPIVRTYQILAHGLVTLAYFALGKAVGLAALYAFASYLAILALPVAIFAAMRMLGFPALTASAAVLLAPLIAGPGVGQLGMELRSWLTFGVFPQCVATSLLLLTLGFAWRAVRSGRQLTLAGAMLGLTVLAHLIYGWMGALCICLMALLPDAEVSRRERLLRTVKIGAVSAILSAFQLLPILQDGYLINRSRLEPVEKFDSIGAAAVLRALLSGRIMDNDRIPVLSLLALGGAALVLWRYRKTRKLPATEGFALAAAVFWILVFFGRPTWGILLALLGVTPDLQLHRVIAGVQIFLLMLAAVGLAELWKAAARRHVAAAVVMTALLLLPGAMERAKYLAQWKAYVDQDVAGMRSEGAELEAAMTLLKQRGGRAYAGFQSGWGGRFNVGDTPLAAFLTTYRVPAIGFPFNASALPSDLMVLFNDRDPAQYRLFNVRSVLAPAGLFTTDFLAPAGGTDRFRVMGAPGTGYFDVVDVAGAASVTRENFFDLNRPWMSSEWFAKQQYIRLDFHGESAAELPLLTPGFLPPVADRPAPAGSVLAERQSGQVYEAELEASRPAYALFRMTWHPNWKVSVDGQPARTVMLSPGFLAAPVAAGRHRIVCRYAPGNSKMLMAAGGLLAVLLLAIWERAGTTPGFLRHHTI